MLFLHVVLMVGVSVVVVFGVISRMLYLLLETSDLMLEICLLFLVLVLMMVNLLIFFVLAVLVFIVVRLFWCYGLSVVAFEKQMFYFELLFVLYLFVLIIFGLIICSYGLFVGFLGVVLRCVSCLL